MLLLGIVLIIGGVLACAFGIAQNTILFNLFADTGAQLARFHSGVDFSILWLFNGPGTLLMIISTIIIILGIVLIVMSRKKSNRRNRNNRNI